jgi:predicted RNA-binding protein
MNEFEISEIVDKINSVFLNILYMKPEDSIIKPTVSLLEDLKNQLNQLFKENNCTDIIYTINTDKQFFGIKINPALSATDTLTILLTDEKVKLNKYQLEFDSKLFDLGLTSEELTATLIFEVSSMMDSYEVIDNVRSLIDLHVLANDDVINLRESANYSQLITYAIKDTLYKVSSIMFKEDPEEIIANKMIQEADLSDSALSAQEKIISSSYGIGDSVREPKTIILQWMFMVYQDMKHNSVIVKDTLKDAKDFTGSRLMKIEIDKTIQAIDNISTQTVLEDCPIGKAFERKGLISLSEISLFKSLKSNGLKSIEDALYEYTIRAKNCDTEEDAMFIIRSINTRLNILEDYIYNTPELSETDRKHWESVAQKYRQLREVVVKKKISKKQYGLFFDYSALDQLDKSED